MPAPKRTKPQKPYPSFPLTAHPAGYWCKKIRGRIYYFGRWEDPDEALARYVTQKDALEADHSRVRRLCGLRSRAETGPLQFGVGDWPGVFLRGKDASNCATALRRLLTNFPNCQPPDSSSFATINGLIDLLNSCALDRSSQAWQAIAAAKNLPPDRGPNRRRNRGPS
ncbi:MAG: hypothetical protein JO110_10345 [Acetobacteraceae bacterium]|nr:hypothetical protein [Acetobacteraceae bacterium]